MITRLDHIDLQVPDLPRAIAFLQVVGLHIVRRTDPARGSVEMALPGDRQVIFELREDRSLTHTTLNHVAFSTDDSAADVARLASEGVTVTKDRVYITHSGRTISNFEDPFGTSWQLTD